MCEEEQKGFDLMNGGLLNSDIYSTACSCSDLIQSFASGAPRTFRVPIYLYV